MVTFPGKPLLLLLVYCIDPIPPNWGGGRKNISFVPAVRTKWMAVLPPLRQGPYRRSRRGVVTDETSGSVVTIPADVQLGGVQPGVQPTRQLHTAST